MYIKIKAVFYFLVFLISLSTASIAMRGAEQPWLHGVDFEHVDVPGKFSGLGKITIRKCNSPEEGERVENTLVADADAASYFHMQSSKALAAKYLTKSTDSITVEDLAAFRKFNAFFNPAALYDQHPFGTYVVRAGDRIVGCFSIGEPDCEGLDKNPAVIDYADTIFPGVKPYLIRQALKPAKPYLREGESTYDIVVYQDFRGKRLGQYITHHMYELFKPLVGREVPILKFDGRGNQIIVADSKMPWAGLVGKVACTNLPSLFTLFGANKRFDTPILPSQLSFGFVIVRAVDHFNRKAMEALKAICRYQADCVRDDQEHEDTDLERLPLFVKLRTHATDSLTKAVAKLESLRVRNHHLRDNAKDRRDVRRRLRKLSQSPFRKVRAEAKILLLHSHAFQGHDSGLTIGKRASIIAETVNLFKEMSCYSKGGKCSNNQYRAMARHHYIEFVISNTLIPEISTVDLLRIDECLEELRELDPKVENIDYSAYLVKTREQIDDLLDGAGLKAPSSESEGEESEEDDAYRINPSELGRFFQAS